jgi:hypothetical protein
MARKQPGKVKKTFWRIVISMVGVGLLLLPVSNLALYFIGEQATVFGVNTRRFGGADNGRPANAHYEWVIGYSFKDKTGTAHSGHTRRRGGYMETKIESKAYYFPSAPFINALEKEAEPNFGQPIMLFLGVLLLYVLNKKKRSPKPPKKSPGIASGTATEICDYDDSIEESFSDNEEDE